MENVNKALLLREKQCYYKLKFFTLFMLQDFDAAKEIEHLVGPLANLEPMVEHLKNI